MKLAILGATGGIGRILLSDALEQGHQITAFVRSPQKVAQQSPRLRVIGGNLLDPQETAAAIRGSDVVLSAFGPTTLRRTDLRRDFGRVLVEALRSARVSRFIHVSSALLFPDAGFAAAVLSSTLFRNVVSDHINSEAELIQPDLDWTIVRPPKLSNGRATGNARSEIGHLPRNGSFAVSRADVAAFMLQEAATPRYIQQIIGVTN
jgi:putative NADH-flavin reductase